MKKYFLVLLFGLIMMAPVTAAQTGDELPLHTKRMSDRVLIAWVGDAMQTIDVVALSTARGIVVIETNLIRSADVRIRRAIEKKFARKDFKYLINTHFHHDHTCGNQVYADATIVAHKSVPEGMKGELTGEGLVKQIEKFKGLLKDWEERQKKAAPDSRDYHFFREGVILLKTTLVELQDGFVPTFPAVLFDKSMILDMGDMTLELYAVGGTHTSGDIIVFVPEEGLVAIGDMWPDQVLPYLQKGGSWDLDLILENWGRVVESGREIKHVNFAHSDMELGVETFKEQYRYLKTMWDGLGEIHRQGATLEEAKKKFTIEKDFPYFKDRRLKIRDTNIHDNNVEAIWEKLAARGSGGPFGPSIEDDFAQIERSIRDTIGWAKTKDFRLLYSVIANDADFLEVHPNDRVVKGFEEFKKAEKFWGSPDFKAVRYEIRDLKITLSKSGDVAWFFCILDDINEWKGQPANWENTRWTGVLEKRGGRWVIVQQHFSFASKD